MRTVDPGVAPQLVEWARAGVLASARPALAGGEIAAALREAGLPVVVLERDAARAKAALAASPAAAPAQPSLWGEVAATAAPAHALAGSAAAIPLRDGAVGAVVDVGSFHAHADRLAALREWRRVLAPRGVLIVADAIERETDVEKFFSVAAGAPRMKSGEVASLIEAAGFEVEHVAIFRFRVPLAELAGGAAAAAGASEHARELYEIKGDSLACRYLTLSARRSAS